MASLYPTTVPSKRLAASITSASSSIQLNNIEGWDGSNLTSSDFGTKLYAVLRNSTGTLMEIIELDPATIASASITILRRGLKFTGDLTTEVSGNKRSWVKNDTIVELGTNVPQLYKHFVDTLTAQTIEGVKTFSSAPISSVDASSANELVRKSQLDAAVLGSLTLTPVVVPGTGGETLLVDQVVYLNTTDGKWYLADADTAANVDNVVLGITRGAGSNGVAITNGVTIFGAHDASSAIFTANTAYYASNTAGGFSTSAGTTEVSLGFAISTTRFYLYPRYNQVLTENQQDLIEKFLAGTDWYAAASSGTDSYTITLSPAPTAYATGMRIRFRTDVANTGACSLNVNGLGAISIKKHNDQDLETGDIEANMIVEVVYDGLSGTFKMVSQTASSPTGGVFGNGQDGDVIIASGTTTLSRDMYYNNLTIQTGGILNPSGYKVFVKGTLSCEGTGKIASNGNAGGAGGNGSGSTAGIAGTAGTVAYSAGTLPIPLVGKAGGAGGNAGAVGNAGTAGTGQAKALGDQDAVAGGTGGTGEGGTYAGGAGGAAGTKSGTVLAPPYATFAAYNLFDLTGATITQYGVAPSSGGGGGGGGGGVGTSGGGGGGGTGSSGGVVWISAYSISILNAEAIGGNGGAGGNSGSDAGNYRGGVGAGGAGGNGGVIILMYKSATTVNTTVTGGTGGAIGTLGYTTSATAGTNGNVGKVYTITIT